MMKLYFLLAVLSLGQGKKTESGKTPQAIWKSREPHQTIGETLGPYKPTWDSIDARPLPTWYDEAKVGIFMHWGVWSVVAYGGYPGSESAFLWRNWRTGNPETVKWMKEHYPPTMTYPDFAADFGAEFYDPNEWADVINASGARYVVLTSKHHEGYCNWPSKVSFNWNSMDVGPHRDLVGELASAIRNRTKIHFGLYHSLFEWFNPLYLQDKANKFETQKFVFEKTLPELVELVNAYKPDVIWSDGDWEAPPEYWNSTEFLAWLYNESPVKDTVVVNDRWGIGATCHHGGYYTCQDRYNPGTLQPHKWENAMTIDSASWGYRRNAKLSDYLTIETLLQTMAETISCGGNILINIGPTHDGRIVPVFEERLRQMGSWLGVNGEAIYSSKPWTHQNDTVTPNIWYTSKKSESGGTSVYAIVLSWPEANTLTLGAPVSTSTTTVSMLGYAGNFKWAARSGGGIIVTFPSIPTNALPCKWAWVLKIENLA